jgi:hypothetical protein
MVSSSRVVMPGRKTEATWVSVALTSKALLRISSTSSFDLMIIILQISFKKTNPVNGSTGLIVY